MIFVKILTVFEAINFTPEKRESCNYFFSRYNDVHAPGYRNLFLVFNSANDKNRVPSELQVGSCRLSRSMVSVEAEMNRRVSVEWIEGFV